MDLRKKLVSLGLAVLLTSCASTESVRKDIKEMQKGPETEPTRNITNFSEGLRCMDNMYIDYGVHDVVVMAEDLVDSTGKVNAGTRDMLITAVSDMTRRSRAIRLVAYGTDSGNILGFLSNAGSQQAFNMIPPYDIRGSISQLDKDVVRKQSDAAIAAQKFGFGAAYSAGGSVLGLDLSVLTTENLSVIPGVTSRNSVIIFDTGGGADGDATIKKSGVSFAFNFSKTEGMSQALRNLVELASMELFGKLLKVPYWQCMGVDPQHADVQREVEDWFYAMSAHGELKPFLQQQLAIRGFYQGPADGSDNPAFTQAVRDYQTALGMSATGQADLAFFNAFLGRMIKGEHRYVAQKAPTPIGVTIQSENNASQFQSGEKLSINIGLDRSGYLYCFYTDASQKIQRFFPNRFMRDNYISPGQLVNLPGSMPFDITAAGAGTSETVTCFATPQDVMVQLPDQIKAFDFEDLDILSIQEVRDTFKSVAGTNLGESQFNIEAY